MATPFLGEIVMFGGNFAPRSWAFCSGQLLPIAQNTALFSILGTTYGGNGQTTFALPDLRGRVPMHPGSGPGLSPRSLGEQGGVENVTLITSQIPSHNHTATTTANANSGPASDTVPTGNFLAEGNNYNSAFNTQMNNGAVQVTIGNSGGSQPHSNIQPFTCINFIIALQGIFPSRN
ncbi:MAG: phage tail protein [Pyrinomonadaceae bacterium]|nr:phage tail protein [Pyrinomonadaceae bacterium]